jgi:OmpA-OmpF porin, OOP family
MHIKTLLQTLPLSVLFISVAIHAQDVSYFDGKEDRTMTVSNANFKPSHPDSCLEKKKVTATAPVAVASVAKVETKTEADSDSDGIVDSKDQCPNTPKGYQVDANGCPKSVTLHINFEFASNTIAPSANKDIEELTQFMNNNPASKITIVGHTDNIGIDARNQPRSEARARALADKLIANHIDATRIATSGKGSKQPIATNKTDAGRAQNRRIEIEIR